jgi:hypothetical protein
MRKLDKQLTGTLRDIITAYAYVTRREPKDALPSISFAQFLRRAAIARPYRERKKRLPPPRFA